MDRPIEKLTKEEILKDRDLWFEKFNILSAEHKELLIELDELKKQLDDIKETHFELPKRPIECASMLISASRRFEETDIMKDLSPADIKALGSEDEMQPKFYSNSELRQIAEHLLVYCCHAEE